MNNLARCCLLQVEYETALAAVEPLESLARTGPCGAGAPASFSTGRLDLDYVRAQISEHDSCGWTSDDLREFQNLHPAERAACHCATSVDGFRFVEISLANRGLADPGPLPHGRRLTDGRWHLRLCGSRPPSNWRPVFCVNPPPVRPHGGRDPSGAAAPVIRGARQGRLCRSVFPGVVPADPSVAPPPYAARSPRQARSATAPTAPRPGRRPQVAAQRCRAPARPNADPPCQRLHLGSHLASAHSRATAEPQQPPAAESGRRASHLRALLRAMGAAPSRRYSESVWAHSRVRHTSCMPDRPTPRTEGIGERLERGASASASVGRLACAAPNRRQDVDLRGVLGDLTPDPPNPRPDSAAGTRKQVPL